MDSELMTQGLLIAAIGMGLVFVVIIFLWGLMALLMRLTSGREKQEPEVQPVETVADIPAQETARTARQRRAAAAAVAVGLAFAARMKNTGSASAEGPKDGISPWQAFHRSREIHPEQRRG